MVAFQVPDGALVASQTTMGPANGFSMPTYRHDLDRVEDYLHHRPPYLAVDRIISIAEDRIVTGKTLSEQEFYFPGHFPGAPIMPGAMMQEVTTQSAGILIAARHNPMPEYNTADPTFNRYALGVLVKVQGARYRGFARPGDTLTATVTLSERVGELFDFTATVVIGERTILRNRFQLTNIESATLIGS
jgi:3-hydroxyacyl-[acyl-carrier-protein] dehydratase